MNPGPSAEDVRISIPLHVIEDMLAVGADGLQKRQCESALRIIVQTLNAEYKGVRSKEDLRVEVLRVPTPLPGPSVVRLTHLPTGIVVTSDEYPSSLQAKAHALHLLRVALAHIDGPKRSRCDVVGHDWRPKMDGPECLRCGARSDGQIPASDGSSSKLGDAP